MQISSVSHGVSRLMSQSSFYYLGATYWSVQPSSFHSNRKRISPFLPLSPWLKEGSKGQINPLIWDFKELGEKEPQATGNVIYMGNLCEDTCFSTGLYIPGSGGTAPREWLLIGKRSKQTYTRRDRGLRLWEKDNRWTFKPRGWEQGLEFELPVWKFNIVRSINYLTDSAPLLLGGQEESGRSLTWNSLCTF